MIRINTENESIYKIKGQDVLLTVTGHILLRLKVVREKRSGYEFEGSFVDASEKARSSLVEKEMLTNKPDSASGNWAFAALHRLLYHPFLIRMNTLGYIQEISGLDAFIEQESARYISAPDSLRNLLKDQFRRSYGDVALRNMLQPFTHIYDVAGISHWKTASQVTKPSVFNIVMYFSTDEPTRLRLSGFGELFIHYEYPSAFGRITNTKLLGKVKSDIDLDVKTGWPFKTLHIQDLVGETVEANKGVVYDKTPERQHHRKTRYEVWRSE